MKRVHWISLGILIVLFSTATMVRLAAPGAQSTGKESEEETLRKERTRKFWDLHREATRYRIAGDYPAAIRLYEEALKLDERHEDALYYLANVYLETGRLTDAEHALMRLVQFHPTSSRGFSRLGDTHLCYADSAMFDMKQSWAAFREALHVNKQETGPLLRMAQVALVEGRVGEAEGYLDDILGSNAASIEANYLSGYIAWQAGDIAAARTMYNRAVRFARDEAPKEKTIGEGDRKNGSAIKPGEQEICPLMLDLIRDVVVVREASATPQAMPASYAAVAKRLNELRDNLNP